MAFYPVQLFLNKAKEEYNISQYRIDIFYDNKNVFSYKKGISFLESILCKKQFIINPKIIVCLSLIMLSVTGKTSLDDNIKKHVSDFQGDEKLEDLICSYLETAESRNELKYFDLISRIVKKLTKCSFEEYAKVQIINPMKMHSTTFDSQGLITNANDYLKLCYNICYKDVFLSKHKNLRKAMIIFSEIIDKTKKHCLSYTDRNGVYTFIDTNRKIIAMYNQIPSNIPIDQLFMFEELETLIIEGFKNDIFSKGYNLFP